MIVRLTRFDSSDHGAFGRLTAERFSCYTGELPWRENVPQVSCVPTGTYQVIWAASPRFKRFTYRLVGVPGRSGVLIHPANLVGDTTLGLRAQVLGCISLGEKLGTIDRQKALLVSRPAVRRFEELMGGQPFILEVTND